MPPLTSADYDIVGTIGHGCFGTIRKVKRKQDGMILARKEISYVKMGSTAKNQLAAEFEILACLDHPNIVKYYHREHIKSESSVHLYMEYCGNGDLSGLIKKAKESGSSFPESFIWTVVSQLVTALYRCHHGIDPPELGDLFSYKNMTPPPPRTESEERNLIKVLHRDLKPENIFVMADNSIKIGDFGLSKKLAPGNMFAETYAGTPYYMSPEISSGRPYTVKSDIWSMGCIIYELCTQELTFTSNNLPGLINLIGKGKYKPIPTRYSKRLRDLVARCLSVDPDGRPDSSQLLEDETIKVFRRELQILEVSKMLKLREEDCLRKEAYLEVNAKALEQRFIEGRQRLERELDGKIRSDWEIRAESVIKEKVEEARFLMRGEIEAEYREKFSQTIELEVQARIAQMDLVPRSFALSGGEPFAESAFNQQLEAEVQKRIAQMDLVPRTTSLSSSNSRSDSGYAGSISPSRATFPNLPPDSPVDIMMESPSAHAVATPGHKLSAAQILRGPPPRMPFGQVSHTFADFNNMQPRAGQTVWADQSPTQADVEDNTSPNLFGRQPLKPPINGLLNLAAKRIISTNANGSPTRVAPRARNGLQRAETTGGVMGPARLMAGFGVNGTGSTDDIATIKPNTIGSSKPKSLVEINQEARLKFGPPADWTKENPKDRPSPFKKS
ncbi:kinase-like protein [Choiromyces venosus 120613-1]|uniref:non-specific serine/threonine protein kinase n=1 Tax=Choiromyces venosus 120613-1 TaxID=1336337 RepID=A0A3N4JLJ3_9PEZI|nr:kinase-like protein [Choiromyces venosus 120613-1]